MAVFVEPLVDHLVQQGVSQQLRRVCEHLADSNTGLPAIVRPVEVSIRAARTRDAYGYGLQRAIEMRGVKLCPQRLQLCGLAHGSRLGGEPRNCETEPAADSTSHGRPNLARSALLGLRQFKLPHFLCGSVVIRYVVI